MGPRPYANTPRGGYQRPGVKPAGKSTTPVQTLSAKKQRKIARARKKERDYFYVMRKGICLFIFLFCLVIIAVSDVGFVPLEGLPVEVNKFTAILAKPDYTPLDQREVAAAEEDGDEESDEAVEYVPKDVYISLADLFYGAAAQLKILEAPESSLVGVTFYNDTLDKIVAKAEGSDDMLTTLAPHVFRYVPIVAVVAFNLLIISLLFALFGMFGKRIFKFGLISLVVLIACVGMLTFGLAGFGAYYVPVAEEVPDEIIDEPQESLLIPSNAEGDEVEDPDQDTETGETETDDEEEKVQSTIDFTNLMSFIKGAFPTIPATEAEATPDAPVVTAGVGFLALIGGGILIFILSIFAKKKIPYAIFDR
jgi:hypothetical protein